MAHLVCVGQHALRVIWDERVVLHEPLLRLLARGLALRPAGVEEPAREGLDDVVVTSDCAMCQR